MLSLYKFLVPNRKSIKQTANKQNTTAGDIRVASVFRVPLMFLY